ncbi:MAG TPA: hypothetical protein VGM23_08965 [Armatimonadota bacterium]|jgi:hypothetical protein
MNQNDRHIIRQLAAEVAEIAALPIQEEKKALWRRLNGLQPVRPLVMIDQVCWHEMNVDDELTLRCEDAECRQYEEQLRRTRYQWRHFPVDMVVEPLIRVPKAVRNTGFGFSGKERTLGDPKSGVVSHAYENQFQTDADLDKITLPTVWHDTAETDRRLEVAHTLFDGILEVIPFGHQPVITVWDPLSAWMGVENALYAIVDRPEFMKELVRRIIAWWMCEQDQLEAQGLLCHHQPLIHCTGAYTDALPAPGFDPDKPRLEDMWAAGLAQMLGTVSPEMYDEFEIEPCLPMFKRFGLIYYGCCDPLDRKMAQVRKIPNVRKISMSPWVDEELGASEIKGDYVFSRKPHPAMLAASEFSAERIREHLQTTVDICARHGCPLELILKDISTVNHQPQRLWTWAEIAMQIVEGS